jgi:hypothetical protein
MDLGPCYGERRDVYKQPYRITHQVAKNKWSAEGIQTHAKARSSQRDRFYVGRLFFMQPNIPYGPQDKGELIPE